MQFASHHKLGNLTLIIDNNGWQAMGRTSSILSLAPLDLKLEAFGFKTYHADGHDLNNIKNQLNKTNSISPIAIISETLKGHGISFTQDQNGWHYKRLTEGLYQKAVTELG